MINLVFDFFRYLIIPLTFLDMGNLWAENSILNAIIFLVNVACMASLWSSWAHDNFKYEVLGYAGSDLIYQKKFLSKKQQQDIIDMFLRAGAKPMEDV